MFNCPKNQTNRLNSSIYGKYPNFFRIFGLYGNLEPDSKDLLLWDIDEFFLNQLETRFFFQIFKRRKKRHLKLQIINTNQDNKIILGKTVIGNKMFIFK